ncbi:retrotransposon protein, putative, ty1-copia subclass [Tanacetum coccineum]
MVRPETIELLILYWTTYIEYGCSELRPEAYDEMVDATQNTNNTTIRSEGKLAHLEQPLIPLPLPIAPQAELFETVKAFHAYKQEDGQSVSAYILKMKGYLDSFERLGYAMPKELGVRLILNSLNKDYDQFVQNYNMHSISKKDETLAVLAIREGKIQKDKKKPKGVKGKGKGKNKLAYASKPKILPPPKRDNLTKDSVCHHYKEVGYWRRNCPSYQAELKKRKNASGLRGSRKLKHGALSLYMGNGMRAVVEAIGIFDLVLPSGLIIVLDNCHFAPTITRGVISISCLVNSGYIHTFTNYGISVSKDNVFYFNAIPRDGIYEIDLHNLYPSVSFMFNVSNKRAKHALDSSYLWHCHLGHINKKRMDKLQRDEILQPIHDESLEKCKSCNSRKMTRKPFPYQVERDKDLLGLIHTDVCGPFRIVSREGASYFITFTDDFIRYGYPKETIGYHFYYPLENKIFVALNAEFFDNSLIIQKASGSNGLLESSGSDRGLKLIQEEDTQPSKNTSKVHNKVAPINVEPQNVKVPIRRSARIPQAPDSYVFYVDIEEYELGDLNEPPNYKVALSDPKFDKWLKAMNMEM